MIEKKLTDGRIILVPEKLTISDLEKLSNKNLEVEVWSTVLKILSTINIKPKTDDITNIIKPENKPDSVFVQAVLNSVISTLETECDIKFVEDKPEPVNYFGGYKR